MLVTGTLYFKISDFLNSNTCFCSRLEVLEREKLCLKYILCNSVLMLLPKILGLSVGPTYLGRASVKLTTSYTSEPSENWL
jgi:hypothetical protein